MLVRVLDVVPVDVKENDMRLTVRLDAEPVDTDDPLGRFFTGETGVAHFPDPPPMSELHAEPILTVASIEDHDLVLQEYARERQLGAVKIAQKGHSGSVALKHQTAIKFQRLRADGDLLCCSGWTELYSLREVRRVCELKRIGMWIPKLLHHRFVVDHRQRRGVIIATERMDETLYKWCKRPFACTAGILVQLVMALVVLQRHCLFYHNDLHTCNVMLSPATHARHHISLEYGMFQLPPDVPDLKLIDLGYVRFARVDAHGAPNGCVVGYGHSCAHEETWTFDLRRICVQLLHQLDPAQTDPLVLTFLKEFDIDPDSVFFPHPTPQHRTPTPHQCLSGAVPSFLPLIDPFRVRDLRHFAPTLPRFVFVHNSDAAYNKKHMRERFLAREYPNSLPDVFVAPLNEKSTGGVTEVERVLADLAQLWYNCTEDTLRRKPTRFGEPLFRGHSQPFAYRFRRYRLRLLRIVCREVHRRWDATEDVAVTAYAVIFALFRETPDTMLPHRGKSLYFEARNLTTRGKQMAATHATMAQIKADPHAALVRPVLLPQDPSCDFPRMFRISACRWLYTLDCT